MRRNPKQVGRAFADWLRRHRGERVAHVDGAGRGTDAGLAKPLTRSARIRAAATVRVTPYQLKRGFQW